MLDDYKIHVSKAATGGHSITINANNNLYGVLAVAIMIGIVILVSLLCFYIARYFMLRIVEKLSRRGDYKWLKSAYRHRVFHRLALLIPAAIIYASAPLFASITYSAISMLAHPIEMLSAAFMIIVSALAVSGFLNSIEDRYNHFTFAKQRPIKSYLQVAKIVLFSLAGLIVVSILLSKSPAYFLTGIGAMTAVIILVFRDSILGFVASIQLAAYDMVRLGDWIEVPSFGADGNVIDISLNTIKVQNFDNAIVMMPSYSLLTNGIKNWRGMSESGSRRIKRSANIDLNTVRFCDEKLINDLKATPMLEAWVKKQNIENSIKIEKIQTNLGLFRQYVQYYVSLHPGIHQDMTLLVRERETDGKGLPLEVYVFTNDTKLENYESIQADIFEHIYAAMPLFDLKVFCKS